MRLASRGNVKALAGLPSQDPPKGVAKWHEHDQWCDDHDVGDTRHTERRSGTVTQGTPNGVAAGEDEANNLPKPKGILNDCQKFDVQDADLGTFSIHFASWRIEFVHVGHSAPQQRGNKYQHVIQNV